MQQGWILSFNPCFIGRTTLTDSTIEADSLANTSFNPCFIGRTTLTYRKQYLRFQVREFQSLFYWKNHFNILKAGNRCQQKNVSILVLLEEPL